MNGWLAKLLDHEAVEPIWRACSPPHSHIGLLTGKVRTKLLGYPICTTDFTADQVRSGSEL